MEKKEARIKCTGCGTSYKIKIPVTDKPVSFTCKKCGKVLKLRIKAVSAPEAPPPPAEKPASWLADLETTQLPDSDSVPDKSEPKIQKAPSFVENYLFPGPTPPGTAPHDAAPPDQVRRWIVLSDDLIKGPFTETEVVQMIKNGEVKAHTSLRMGERPWIKAADTPDFKNFFVSEHARRDAPIESFSLLDKDGQTAAGQAFSGQLFYTQWSSLVGYPVASGDPKPLIIFFAIAFGLSTFLFYDLVSRSMLEVILRLCLILAGWIVLYGYLADLMNHSMQSPEKPPPAWDFSRIKALVEQGLKVLAVLLLYALIPVGICFGLTIIFFLNAMPALGYLFIALTILVFLASLCVVSPAVAILAAAHEIGRALNPSQIIGIIQKGGVSYRMLAVASIVLGLVGLLVVVLAVFLVEIPMAGFAVAGIVMAMGLSYCFFVWFHVLGRFSAENRQLTGKVPAGK